MRHFSEFWTHLLKIYKSNTWLVCMKNWLTSGKMEIYKLNFNRILCIIGGWDWKLVAWFS
jgi:hypothetical protein